MALVAARSLSAMQGDADTKLTEFFERWGGDMSADLAERLDKICKAFMEKHAVTRIGTLFKLRRAQAEAIFVECGAGEGWITTLEELAGFRFTSAPAPDSLSLTALSNGTEYKPKPKYKPTLSDSVVEKGAFESERIPEYVFDASKCACPEVDTLKESDVERVTDRMLEYLAAKHGAWNIGKPLARNYGAQLAARLPYLPRYGKTAGRDRLWWMIVWQKCKNRTHVCRAPPAPPHPLPPRQRFLPSASSTHVRRSHTRASWRSTPSTSLIPTASRTPTSRARSRSTRRRPSRSSPRLLPHPPYIS